MDRDKKLELIADYLIRLGALDFSSPLPVEDPSDPLDVIAFGINLLAEELNGKIVEKNLLEEKQKELEKANESLDKFAFTVSHDLKSPLNSAKSLVALLKIKSESAEKEDVSRYYDMLEKVLYQMGSLIEGILTYSRSSVKYSVKEPLDLNVEISRLVGLMNPPENVKITIQPGLPVIVQNKTTIERIFQNLISNAIKYNDKTECKIEISFEELPHFFEFTVSDNGRGVREEDRLKIFELFNQVNSDRKINSTGIGLATVRKIIKECGGDIRVESDLGIGSRFIFTLPKN